MQTSPLSHAVLRWRAVVRNSHIQLQPTYWFTPMCHLEGPAVGKQTSVCVYPKQASPKQTPSDKCSIVVTVLLLGGSQPSMSFLGRNCSTSHRTSNGGLSGQIKVLESHPPRVRDLMILKLFLIGSTTSCFHVAPQGTTSKLEGIHSPIDKHAPCMCMSPPETLVSATFLLLSPETAKP